MRNFAAVLVIFLVGAMTLAVLITLLYALLHGGTVTINVDYFNEGWIEVALVTGLLIAYPWAVLKRVRAESSTKRSPNGR